MLVRTITAYLVCIGLIPLYVTMFPLWKYLSSRFGSELFIYLPIAVTLIAAVGIIAIIYAKHREHTLPLFSRAIFIGLLLCIAGLIIPDPAFPVKRIHVAEYLFLALIARYAMAPFLGGIPLLFFSSCFAAILGMHDEFLQGIHPARTYGLRDMTVNALASLGGGLIGHGLSLFTPRRTTVRGSAADNHPGYDSLYLGWLLISIVMLVIPAAYFRGMNIETWTIAPLLASIVYFSLYRAQFRDDLRHGITALNCAAWSLACYPFITEMKNFAFY